MVYDDNFKAKLRFLGIEYIEIPTSTGDNCLLYSPEANDAVLILPDDSDSIRFALSYKLEQYLYSLSTNVETLYIQGGKLLKTFDRSFNGLSIKKLNLEGVTAQHLISLAGAFESVEVQEIEFGNLNTKEVASFVDMFYRAYIGSMNLSNFDYSSANDLEQMFKYCVCKKLDMTNFDKFNKEHKASDRCYTSMFSNAQLNIKTDSKILRDIAEICEKQDETEERKYAYIYSPGYNIRNQNTRNKIMFV